MLIGLDDALYEAFQGLGMVGRGHKLIEIVRDRLLVILSR